MVDRLGGLSFIFQSFCILLYERKKGVQAVESVSFAIIWVFEHGPPDGWIVGFQPDTQEEGSIWNAHASFVTIGCEKIVKTIFSFIIV